MPARRATRERIVKEARTEQHQRRLRGDEAADDLVTVYGTAVLDFGAFPGTTDTFVAVGNPQVRADSFVQAWVRPAATADHTHDEHIVEEFKVMAGDVRNGGFRVYGVITGPGPVWGKWSVAWGFA